MRERKHKKNQSFFLVFVDLPLKVDDVRTRDALANDLGVLVDPHVRRDGGALAARFAGGGGFAGDESTEQHAAERWRGKKCETVR
jgi:hypothetical protein